MYNNTNFCNPKTLNRKRSIALKLIKKYLLPHRAAAICCLITLVFQAVFSLAMPFFMGKLIGTGIQQKGVDDIPPEVFGNNLLEIFEVIMPAEEYGEFAAMYKMHNRCPKGQPDEFELLRNCYYLEENADKDRAKELFETAALCGVFIAREYLDGGKNSQAADFADNVSLTMLSAYLKYTKAKQGDFADEWQTARNTKQALKAQAAATFMPFVYKDAGVDIETVQNVYIAKYALLMAASVVLQIVCMVVAGKISASISSQVQRDIRADYIKHTYAFSAKELKIFSAAHLEEVAVRDVEHIGMLVSYFFRVFAFAPILAVGGTVLSFMQSRVFGSLLLITVLVIVAVLVLLFLVTIKKFDALQAVYEKYVKHLKDNLAQLFTVRSGCAEGYEASRINKVSDGVRRNERFVLRSVYIALSVITLVSNIITAVLVVVGGEEILNSSLGVGEIVAFLQYSVITVSAFVMLGAMVVFAPRAAVAAKNVGEIMSTPVSVVSGNVIPDENEKWNVEFKDVSLKNGTVSFTANHGEVTAIVGTTGCGKSTLLSYITRFDSPESGEIIVGGRDVRDYELDALRKNISFAQSKPVLFSKTLRENLLLHGSPDSAAIMLDALQKARCGFIASEEKDLQKFLINKGENYSGGQRSRIAVAGAIAKNAKVYVFDDCFTALDTETEAAIMSAVSQKCKNAAVLLVSQRMSSVKNADKIIVLSQNGVEGEGRHDELVETCGLYRELVELQSGEVSGDER